MIGNTNLCLQVDVTYNDFSRDFDKIHHYILLKKLAVFGVLTPLAVAPPSARKYSRYFQVFPKILIWDLSYSSYISMTFPVASYLCK